MPPNTAPFEIIGAPFTVWIAPVATAFPVIDAAASSPWVKIGTSGDLNYNEEGVTIQHEQSLEYFRSLGSTGPRKAFRPDEMLIISMLLHDVSLEQYAVALNHNTVASDAPGADDAGDKIIGLSRGLTVARRALLVRGPSPYGDAFTMQYEVPVVVLSSSQEVTFAKNEPAGLALEWTALEDPSASSEFERFGRLQAQTAAATPP